MSGPSCVRSPHLLVARDQRSSHCYESTSEVILTLLLTFTTFSHQHPLATLTGPVSHEPANHTFTRAVDFFLNHANVCLFSRLKSYDEYHHHSSRSSSLALPLNLYLHCFLRDMLFISSSNCPLRDRSTPCTSIASHSSTTSSLVRIYSFVYLS